MENYNLEPFNMETSEEKYLKEETYLRAKEKVKNILGFYWHLVSYIIVNIFIIVLIVSNGGTLFSFGTFATAIFWGIGLFFHFLGIYGPDFLFGKNWEHRKIKEFIDKEQNQQKFE